MPAVILLSSYLPAFFKAMPKLLWALESADLSCSSRSLFSVKVSQAVTNTTASWPWESNSRRDI